MAAKREAELKAGLERLPAGEQVSWCNSHLDSPPVRLEMPPEPTVRALIDEAEGRQIVIRVCAE